jgi:lysine N6-hydroxylase
VHEQDPTGDAMTPGALRTLYQLNYDGLLEHGHFPITLLPGRDVVSAEAEGDGLVLHCKTAEQQEHRWVRRAVVAVGRELAPLPLAAALRERLDTDEDGELLLQGDYSVRWGGTNEHRIYALNRARYSHGIPDANLTLLPVRSALVLNSMLQRELFPINDQLCPIQWG